MLFDYQYLPMPLPIIIGRCPMEETMRPVVAEATAQGGVAAPSMEGIDSEIAPLLSLLLYLCGEAVAKRI